MQEFLYFCAKSPVVKQGVWDSIQGCYEMHCQAQTRWLGVPSWGFSYIRGRWQNMKSVISLWCSLLRSPFPFSWSDCQGLQPFSPHLSARHSHPVLRALLNPGPLRYSLTREQRWQDWALLAKPETKQMEWTADQSPAGPARLRPQWELRQG